MLTVPGLPPGQELLVYLVEVIDVLLGHIMQGVFVLGRKLEL